MSENKTMQDVQDVQDETMQDNATPAALPTPTAESYQIGTASTALVYTTLDVSTAAGKKKLYRIKNHPDHTLSEFVNKPIRVTDIYVDVNPRTNKDPESDNYGVVEDKPRTVLIDENGESYVAGVSIGIFNAVKEIIRTFGDPSTWEEPLEVVPVYVKTPKGNMLSLDIV